MSLAAPPSDRELLALLGAGSDREVTGISRRPYRYATSAPLEELIVRRGGSADPPLIFKDLSRDRLIGQAATTKPDFLYEPLREIETYRRILSPAGIGPSFVAAEAGGGAERQWLVIERVPGVELWQVGELEVWEATAHWLGGLHAAFEGTEEKLRAANPHLLEHDEQWYVLWCERALQALGASPDARSSGLVRELGAYGREAERLAELPRTFVHGEFYPSNVMVETAGHAVAVRPVDWEMAGIGAGLGDLAALVSGWAPDERRRLLDAYLEGLAGGGVQPPSAEDAALDLVRCRLHQALQWLGWSQHWRPPPEHAHDWLDEAIELTRSLELR